MKLRKSGLAGVCAVLLTSSACSIFSIHKIDVRQGNALEAEAVEQLKVGMNAEQVRFLLGNPVIDDSYHHNRWDYVYYYKPENGQIRQRKLTVFFKEGQVVRISPPRLRRGMADG